MTLEALAPYIAIIVSIGTLLYGALGLRRNRSRDLVDELRDCEKTNKRLRQENVELLRQVLRLPPIEPEDGG